ncbi:MAG: hypothetical protein K0Q66_810 [Chitinophagaceae bacterium]|jgi:hypothetical protein|nr:hypothetical protein [Chitinophagaceae bacterium]
MLQYLHTLQVLMQPGITLQRNEVIRRYRSLKNFNKEVLKMICMTEFFSISKNEKGELTMV